MKRLLVLLALGSLALTACGSDDGDTASASTADRTAGGDTDPEAIADLLVDAAGDEGFDLDRDCIVGLAGQLSEADRELLAADPAGDPELSPAGEALGEQLVTCIEFSEGTRAALAASIAEEFGGEDPATIACVTDVFADLSDDDLLKMLRSQGDDLPASLKASILECVPATS